MSARGWSNFTPDTYMRDEEREANRRMRRRDPFKAEREEAFRAGLSGNWRSARPGDVPPRVTTPDRKAASIKAWRSAPAVRREYERGLRNGWVGAMLFYGVASAVLVLAFHVLGFRP